MSTLQSHLAAIIVIVTIIDGYGLKVLSAHGLTNRFVFVEDIQSVQPRVPNEVRSRATYWGEHFDQASPKVLMSSVMNQVEKIESNPKGDAITLFEHAQEGGGLVCSGMAAIYSDVLYANGHTSRQVRLVRALGDRYSTHATVEVKEDGRWIIYDPTFNVTFEKDGLLLSAQDIHRALLDGSYHDVKPIFNGEVAYPARLDDYYMDYLSLYNNVMITEQASKRWQTLPPFRFWFGTKFYVQIESALGQKNQHMIFANTIIFLFVAALPIFLLAAFSVFCFLFLVPKRVKS